MRKQLRDALQVIKDECGSHNMCNDCAIGRGNGDCIIGAMPYPFEWVIPEEEPENPLAYTE